MLFNLPIILSIIHDYQVITSNLIGIIILIVLLLNVRTRFQKERKDNIAFVVMVGINIVLCIIEPLEMLLEGGNFEGLNLLLRILNGFCFLFNILFAMMWAIYTKLRLCAKNRNFKLNIFQFIPGLIVVLLSILNMIPGIDIFFKVSAANEYFRNAIPFTIAYSITYCYLILGVYNVYRYKKSIEEYTFLPVFTFLMPIIVASIAQLLMPGISVLWCGAAVGLLSTYLSLINESSLVDPLSGVLSRMFLDRYVGDLPKSLPNGRSIIGIMFDIDNFKAINDIHGHVIGDDAISCFAKIIRKVVGIEGMVFRYGGDEFIIIMTVDNDSYISALLREIENEVDAFNKIAQKPYFISYSCGLSKYIPGESNKLFIERMDKEMYKVKNHKKGIESLD